MSKAKVKRIRLQFDFSEEAMARLKTIRSQLDAASYAEVIRRSLKLMEYVLDCNKDILLLEPDGNTRGLDVL